MLQRTRRQGANLSIGTTNVASAAPRAGTRAAAALLEISISEGGSGQTLALWLQVRDIWAEQERLLRAGVTVLRPPRVEPWGLVEMWIEDPDGVRIVLVEVPDDHPLRRDQR
jgi:predicted enzyme related to lactoylglutathione lyase